MKQLHRPDLFGWSSFDEERNIDFNSICWVREGGNVLIDPLPMSDHDRAHVESLGGASVVVVTNSDHLRDAPALARLFGAELVGPAEDPIEGAKPAGDVIVPGLAVHVMNGSKTPGELALILEETTLITGDLIRAHRPAELMFLPAAKLEDPEQARASVARLVDACARVETVLVGDGWHLFGGAQEALRRLVS